MKPRKAIPRGKPPVRRTRLAPSRKRPRPRKQDPAKRRFAKHRCQPYLDWLKTQPCAITGWRTGEWVPSCLTAYQIAKGGYDATLYEAIVDPTHDISRSLGGDDLYNAIPLLRQLHDVQHHIGWPRFEARYGIDRKTIAREHTERFLESHPEFAEQD